MKYSTVLIILSILCVSVYGRRKPTPNNLNTRIYNGNLAPEGAFPYVAYLQRYSFLQGNGVILNNRWILGPAQILEFNIKRGIVGTNNYKKGGQHVSFELAINHPDYDATTVKHDIALFKTTENITFNENTKPIALPTSPVGNELDAVVSGWGAINEEYELPDELRYLPVRTLTYKACRKSISAKLFDSQICAYSANPTKEGPFIGDAGAPLVVNGTIAGLFTRYAVNTLDGEPLIYTDVYSHLDWINKILKEYS